MAVFLQTNQHASVDLQLLLQLEWSQVHYQLCKMLHNITTNKIEAQVTLTTTHSNIVVVDSFNSQKRNG